MHRLHRIGSTFLLAALAAATITLAGQPSQSRGVNLQAAPHGSSTFISWRGRAKSVIADVVNASIDLEAYYSVHNSYPTSKKVENSSKNRDRIVLTRDDRVTIQTDGEQGFCILGTGRLTIYNDVLPKVYDTTKGGLQPDGVTGHSVSCSLVYRYSYTLP